MSEGRITGPRIQEVLTGFDLGVLVGREPLGNGHIHETVAARWRDTEGGSHEAVLQRLNEQVFPDLDAVMSNLERVVDHPGVRGKVPELLRTRDGRSLIRDSEGRPWRAYARVQGTTSYDLIEDPALAEAGARVFAAFGLGLADLGEPPLLDPLPGFHDTSQRLRVFQQALEDDTVARAHTVPAETEALLRRANLVTALDPRALPTRVTHNDTKLNNVLFDPEGRAVAVVDLDTVAPGLLGWDFGDLVRSAANTALEDAPNPAAVGLDLPIFRALVTGWFEGAAGRMTSEETSRLGIAAQVMTYELALRFGTDWLQGDSYFRIKDPEHNLRRVRVQLALLASMEHHQGEMEEVVAEAKSRLG